VGIESPSFDQILSDTSPIINVSASSISLSRHSWITCHKGKSFVNTKSRCRTLCYLEAAILLVLGLAAAHAAPTLNPKSTPLGAITREARSPCNIPL